MTASSAAGTTTGATQAQALDLGCGGHEDRGFPAFGGKQLAGVDASCRARRGDAAGIEGGVKLAERTQIPGQQIAGADDAGDGRRRRRVDPALADGRDRGRVGEQVPQ